MKQLLLVLTIGIFSLVGAQDNILLKGVVIDKATNEPLGLSAVQIKNSQLGALTEDNGYFELPMPRSNLKDSLRISFMGYLPKTISISSYSGDTLKVYLETSVAEKDEVVVTAMNAKGVLLKAIENLRQNLYRDSIIQTGLYRQYHKENGVYVRLIEADVSVAMNTKSPYKYSVHEVVQTNKIRRSESYETNGDVHGDHLMDLLKENPFSYNRNTLLNPKNLDFFSPKFDSEDAEQYVLKTQYKETSSAKLEQAKIWIQKETFAILRIEIEKFPNPYYVRPKYVAESRWKLVNEKDIIELEKRDGKYFVSSLERVYNHHVLNRQTGQVEFVVEESFELYFDAFETERIGEKIMRGKFFSQTALYDTPYKYDENFWKNYELLEDYELPEGVKKDLDAKRPLDQQFREAGKIRLDQK